MLTVVRFTMLRRLDQGITEARRACRERRAGGAPTLRFGLWAKGGNGWRVRAGGVLRPGV
jgi:hypothetical protein